jgi:formate-dependent nitrite reductase cytochrome c552 subunit
VDDWAATAHARAGVNCTACHTSEDSNEWSDKATHEKCAKCHASETQGFLSGKHGMRLAQKLSPMKPSLARQPMKKAAAHKELTCIACHNDHRFDTRHAAVDACVACHDDAHTLAYKKSSHYQLWLDEQTGDGPAGSGVSCATCHLPRVRDESGRVFAQHNQNDNLRPNEKMVRTVCNDCHGVSFALDALAGRDLIDRCFQGQPSKHVESPEMAKAWFDSKANKRKQ